MSKVLNIGSLNYDNVYQMDHMVKKGETASAGSMNVFLGGKGLNQSVAAARAGLHVFHAGAVGEDGAELCGCMESEKIDTHLVRRLSGRSGHTIIQVDKDGDNCIIVYPGTNGQITQKDIHEILEEFGEGDFVIIQNEVSNTAAIIEACSAKKMVILFNPSPYDGHIAACDLGKVGVLLINETEGRALTGEENPEAVVSALIEKYPKMAVVLTLGSEGVLYAEGVQRIRQQAVKVKAVDTTAAGDTFTGYFIAGLVRGEAIEKILKQCVCASALACTRAGAVPSIPYMEEVQEMEKRHNI